MVYVFDTSSFIVLSHYYEDQFPSLWKKVNTFTRDNKMISVREVFREIDSYGGESDLKKWAKENKHIFQSMSQEESKIMINLFKKYPKFQDMVNQKSRLKGNPVADPFIVTKAIHSKGTVVSEESFQKNGIKIPNLCKTMKVPCCKLQDFMKHQKWKF